MVRALVVSALLLVSGASAQAQSFFVDLGIDPATGVDRGSASAVQRVEERTGFLTFSSTGAEEIGPYIASATLAWPKLLHAADQMDLVLVLGGLSDENELELTAVGAGYRYEVPGTGLMFFANADHGAYDLGSAASLALDIGGDVTNAAVGIRKVWNLPEHGRLTATAELAVRESESSILGAPFSDESLRMIRAALRYDKGLPFSFRQRYGVSVTKGVDGFGASAVDNPLASAPGVTTDFLKMAFSAEMSLPVSARFVVNAGIVGQWTDDSLPVSQRCGYGTNAYARGFDLSYVNGDRCFGGRAELAYFVNMPDPRAKALDLRQAYFGLDGGTIEDLTNPLVVGNVDSWSSVSAGLRIAKGNFIGEVSLTRILDKPAGAFEQDDTRVWFQAAVRF